MALQFQQPTPEDCVREKLSNYVSHKVLGPIIPLSCCAILRVTNCSLVKEIGHFNVQRSGSRGRKAQAAAIVDVLKLLQTLRWVRTEQSTREKHLDTAALSHRTPTFKN